MKKLFLTIAVLTLSACASSVNVDFDPRANFSRLNSFVVEAMPVNEVTDPRVNSPFMLQRVVNAIGDNLALKGMQVNKTSPDIRVKYHLLVKQEIISDDSGVTLGLGTGTHHSFLGMAYTFPEREVTSIDNLVVTIDMHDAQGTLLWRGSLGRRLYDGSTPASSTRLINGLVEEILKEFPPK